jgi:hypothetical protein
VLEDWIWHIILPPVSYGMVLAGAVSLSRHTHGSLFAIATASVLLLVIGIHNAWDTVTYLTLEQEPTVERAAAKKEPPAE